MRFVVLGLCLAAFAGGAAAQTNPAPPVLDQVYTCAGVAAEAERLACYDAAVGRLREAQTTGAFVGIDRDQAQEINRQSFGFSLPALPRLFGGSVEPETENVVATVERISRGGDGAVFHLSNTQVWAQVDSESSRAIRPGATVTVRRAALGSFMLTAENSNRSIRVRRQE